MPGIAGFLGKREHSGLKKIERMAKAMSYENFYHSEMTCHTDYFTCASLLEQKQSGIFETDQVIVSFYGEIFKVTGSKMIDKLPIKDAETLYYYLDKYGFDIVKEFNGAFAFAFYEKTSHILKIATDRISIHRLYFWRNDDIFAFSSEVKNFYQLDSFVPVPDYTGIAEFLTNRYCYGDRSFWENVWLLPPGSMLTFEVNHISVKKYWEGKYNRNEKQSNSECVNQLYESINNAVKIRLPVEDVSMGLSGGCDSRIIINAIYDNSDIDIHSFTYGTEECGDVICAKQLAKIFESDEEVVDFNADDLVKHAAEAVWRTDGLAEADYFFQIKLGSLKRSKARYEISSVPGDAISGKLNSETSLLYRRNKTFLHQEEKDKIYKKLYHLGLAGKPKVNNGGIFEKGFVDVYKEKIEEDFIRACRERCTNDDLYGVIFQHQLLMESVGRSVPVMAGLYSSFLTVRVPFLDNDVIDCCGTLPSHMWKFQRAYLLMIRNKYPMAAKVPHYVTDTPISPQINKRYNYLKIKDYLLRKIGRKQSNPFFNDTYDFIRNIIKSDELGYVVDLIEQKHTLNDYLFTPLRGEEIAALFHSAQMGNQEAYGEIRCRFNAAVLSEVFFSNGIKV